VRAVISAVAVVIIVAGVVFTLQGVGVIGGSFMSGSALWAVLGPIIALAGVTLLARSRNRS
jgi:hypothetical protein